MMEGIFFLFFINPNSIPTHPNNAPSACIYAGFLKFYNEATIKERGQKVMNKRQTSKPVASKASKILKDGRYGKNVKSVAGSALSQTKTGRKK